MAKGKEYVVDAECVNHRRDVIRRDLYRRWELNLNRQEGDIEGEVFIKKEIAPPLGSKLRVTIKVIE